MVDWEDSGLQDPACDLADVMTHIYQEDLLSWNDWQALLEPYISAQSRLDPHLAHRMHLYLALYPLFWLSVIIRESMRTAASGESGGQRSHETPINQRLRRYLARGSAWPQREFEDQLATLADVTFFPDP
jgi:thiamine kinase-like enzyme